MFFNRSKSTSPTREKVVPLKPFVLRIKDGHLLGLAMEPGEGSPCSGCVERWLHRRRVFAEAAPLSELKLRRELIAELLAGNSAHVFYEIMNDGSATRLEGAVFPHPECACSPSRYIAPESWTKKTNFAFSPIHTLRCARFSTPDGNLWLAQATGDAIRGEYTASGVGTDRDVARFLAVDRWMLNVGIEDLRVRAEEGGAPVSAEILQTGAATIIPPQLASRLDLSGMGAGTTHEEALQSALYNVARTRTLRQYASAMKSPMLVVGANAWLRNKVPFFLLQEYDLHPLFYPNATPTWVVGIAAFSRKSTTQKPLFAFGSHGQIGCAMDMAIGRILEMASPPENQFTSPDTEGEDEAEKPKASASKLNLWWTHWLYRCPKISLKDVLHLENYTHSLSQWRDFFRDGVEPLTVLSLNSDAFPSSLRHLVAISEPAEARLGARNVGGVGSLTAFREQLL